MNKVKKALLSFMVVVSLATSGCLSYNTLKTSNSEINQRKAIVAQQLGDDGVGIGVNLLSWEALKEHPWKQLWAAFGDALMLWGANEAKKQIEKFIEDKNDNDNEDDSDSPKSSAPDTDNPHTVNINGDNNTIIIK